MAEAPQQIAMRLVWVGVEDTPIVFANQILSQLDDAGEAILMFGQAAPPILIGTPEEQLQQAQSVPFIQVRPTARVSLSRPRLEQLAGVIQQTLDQQAGIRAAQANDGSQK